MRLLKSIEENKGLYSLREAAIYARVAPITLHRWLFGMKGSTALRSSEIDTQEGKFVTFIEFVEAAAIGELRKKNISLQKIREAIDNAKTTHRVEHPFAHEKHKCYIIGKDLFITIGDSSLAGLTGKDRNQISISAPSKTLSAKTSTSRNW